MTRHYTIGVAGHVDHGKTALTKTITGINTDRMQEEKQKGLSMVAGIAPLSLPSGAQAALVDLPGHSDYLKNTVSGLAGIDMTLLVVAADEGVMPQTREHLNILQFYGIKHGVVVLSKADLVDEEILELADLEIKDLIKASGFPDWPVLPFSARTKTGLQAVITCVDEEIRHLKTRTRQAPFRLWIDQARIIAGFGTVVSGTVLSGAVSQNDTVQVLPDGRKARARFLETHGEGVPAVEAGQRAGMNLPRIPLDVVKKGAVLVTPDTLRPAVFLNADLRLLKNAPLAIRNRMRVRLYVGTGVFNALLVIMDSDTLSPGQAGLVQFRPATPIACMPDDRFVISFLNKNEIIGGGRILEVSREKFRQAKAAKIIPVLEAIQKGDLPGYLAAVSANAPYRLISAGDTANRTPFPETAVAEAINRGVNQQKWVRISKEEGGLRKDHYDTLMHHVKDVCESVLTVDKLKQKFQINEIADTLAAKVSRTLLQHILTNLCRQNKLWLSDGYYQLSTRTDRLSSDHRQTISALMTFADDSGTKPFSAGYFCKCHRGKYPKKTVEKLLWQLESRNQLIQLDKDRYITPRALEDIKYRIKDYVEQQGYFSIHDCQEAFGYGRTQAVPVLEYLDNTGFTKREENVRTLQDNEINYQSVERRDK
ncbi:MAG: selenocysteine-specific translation elongation factor [Thermodesulfobacteriota bacterium]|nr:selenocysteine-specific translation elongation factor [Thermodesulfobacteriota bacterium]